MIRNSRPLPGVPYNQIVMQVTGQGALNDPAVVFAYNDFSSQITTVTGTRLGAGDYQIQFDNDAFDRIFYEMQTVIVRNGASFLAFYFQQTDTVTFEMYVRNAGVAASPNDTWTDVIYIHLNLYP